MVEWLTQARSHPFIRGLTMTAQLRAGFGRLGSRTAEEDRGSVVMILVVIVFMTRAALASDVCPWVGVTPTPPLLSDVAISDAGNEKVSSYGYLSSKGTSEKWIMGAIKVLMNRPVTQFDSGALVVSNDGNNSPIGTAFSASTDRTSVLAIPIQQVVTDLGIDSGSTLSVVGADNEEPNQSQRQEDAIKLAIEKNAWLKKLPHVAFVEPAWSEDDGYIAVFADRDESVSVVEREVPSKVDGYSVVVLPPQRGVDL